METQLATCNTRVVPVQNTGFTEIVDHKVIDRNFKNLSIDTECSSVEIRSGNSAFAECSLYGNVLELASITYIYDEPSDTLFLTSENKKLESSHLLVQLPRRYFQRISVNSHRHDIYVAPNVCVHELALQSSFGNIESDCGFARCTACSCSGTIDIRSIAKSNIVLNIKTNHSPILLDIAGIGMLKNSIATAGKLYIRRNRGYGHCASGTIVSSHGNIRIIY